MKLIIILIGLCILFVGCGPKICEESKKCVEYEIVNEPCLSHIIYHIPNGTNETFNIPLTLYAHELCYDFNKDEDNIKEEVNKVFEEHPDDWEDYINWTPHNTDPKILVVEDNVTEITEERIFNGTKLIKNCTKTKKILVCR